MSAKVALIKGNSRRRNIIDALSLVADEINLADKKSILIKPNLTYTNRMYSTTHPEAVAAVLEFLKRKTKAEIWIGEGTALTHTFEAYHKLGYLKLSSKYGVKLVDLNLDEWIEAQGVDRNFKPLKLRVSKKVAGSDFRISIAPPKTHDCVILTAALKNILVGSLIRDEPSESLYFLQQIGSKIPAFIRQFPLFEYLKTFLAQKIPYSDKLAIHQGYPAMNLTLANLSEVIAPHLSIVDGFVGMEGLGPTDGSPVPLKWALASTDFLAAEVVCARLCGFNPDDIGYLYYCKERNLGEGNLENIEILGTPPEECKYSFKPHPYYNNQLAWRIKKSP